MASDMDRRSFLKIGAVGATGLAQGIPTASLAETKISADKDPGVRQYVELAKPDCAYRISRLARVR